MVLFNEKEEIAEIVIQRYVLPLFKTPHYFYFHLQDPGFLNF